jgi:integrase
MSEIIDVFELHMRTAKMSPETIKKRLEILRRLEAVLEYDDYSPKPLIEATPDDLAAFQGTFADLAPASMDIYTRHVMAFYAWAVKFGHIETDPCSRLVSVRVRKGLPHPTSASDVRLIFACTRRPLRTAYVLAAYGGLRCGEVCRLRWEELNLAGAVPSAFVHGKGGKERVVPLLPAVVDELQQIGPAPKGYVLLTASGRPYQPSRLSVASSKHLRELHVASTLHSLRHYYATAAYQATRDILLVRDLIGHESVGTTQIYTRSSLDGAHARLDALAHDASGMLGGGQPWTS